jgi:Protein of unknown function (DUF3987)
MKMKKTVKQKKNSKKAKIPSVQQVSKLIETLKSDIPSQPRHRRYKSNDATVEKLGEMLRDNPNGLLILRDELVGLLASWEKSGHEGDRTFYLESWNGSSSFDTDRIGRGSIFIPNLCLSLFGGIQPDKLRSLLELIADALANDGTLQRFQILVYPDNTPWEWRDQIPDKAARDAVYDIFEKLADFEPVNWGASPSDTYNKFPFFKFSHEAQELFIEWSTKLHREKIATEDDQLIVQHLAKYEKLFASLALIFHLVDCAANNATGDVRKEAALLAWAWCDYLETHARRCYSLLADDGACSALALSKKIEDGKLKDGFTGHEVLRHGWRYLSKPESVQPALAWLEDRGWIRSLPIPTTGKGGRPTIAYQINPKTQKQDAPIAGVIL